MNINKKILTIFLSLSIIGIGEPLFARTYSCPSVKSDFQFFDTLSQHVGYVVIYSKPESDANPFYRLFIETTSSNQYEARDFADRARLSSISPNGDAIEQCKGRDASKVCRLVCGSKQGRYTIARPNKNILEVEAWSEER